MIEKVRLIWNNPNEDKNDRQIMMSNIIEEHFKGPVIICKPSHHYLKLYMLKYVLAFELYRCFWTIPGCKW